MVTSASGDVKPRCGDRRSSTTVSEVTGLNEIAPVFIEMAHRMVWCTAATVDVSGAPRTRVLHPIWEWENGTLTGWIATSPLSPKAQDLAKTPQISLNYWTPSQDTATADCKATWENSPAQRQAGWDRFAEGPAPVGYDLSMIPEWTDPQAEAFGILRVEPYRLRLMPGTLMTQGLGELLSWRA